jgi:hypothetical protein
MGGLSCCHHLYYLTDKNQSHLIPEEPLIYQMKARFYFQEYEPARYHPICGPQCPPAHTYTRF